MIDSKYYNDLLNFFDCLDGCIVIYSVIDDECYIDFMNKSALKLEKSELNNIINRSVREVYPDVVGSGLFDIFLKVFKEKKQIKKDIYYNDGIISGMRYNIVNAFGNDKIIVKYSDIRTDEILIKYKKNLDNTPLGTFIINEKGIINYVNKSFCNLINITEKELLNTKIDNYFEKSLMEYINRLDIQINDFFQIELSTRNNKDIILNIMELYENEIIVYCTDITDIKTYNIQLKKTLSDLEIAKNKAEKSDNLKTSFLANISHDIRTPLNAIVGFSNMLQKATKENREKYINIINKNSDILTKLINDIIDLSKIESNQIQMKSDKCVLIDILTDVYHTNRNNVRENVKLLIEKKLTNIIIYTDKYRLTQVLNNLTSNALKFTTKGNVKIGYEINKGSIKFYVKDTGSGIPKEEFEHIFDRFYQIDFNQPNGGTGLGLSISKNIVKLLGGKIWLESEVNKGTNFYVEIPSDYLQKIEYEYEYIVKDQNIIIENKHALIIEDVESSSLLLKTIFDKMKIKSTIIKYGIDSIKLLNENKYDIIFMDIQLQDISGYELIKSLKKIKDIPIIAQSAHAMPSMINKALDSGFDDYLVKPIEINKLVNIVIKYLK